MIENFTYLQRKKKHIYEIYLFRLLFSNFVDDRLNENLFEIILKNISVGQKFNFKYTNLFESHF
jgi:hypothetical protein